MKIIFSTDSLERGGKERVMVILASESLKQKHKLIFLAKRKGIGNNYLKEYQINHDSVEVYKSFLQYFKSVRDYKPDLIVSWDGITSFYNLLLYRIFSFKFINGSIRHGIRLNKFSHLFRSLICKLSPFVMANSEAGLRANNLEPGKTSFILYNGIEPKFYNILSKSEITDLRNKIIPGYTENQGFVYITVANFVPFKDYFTILRSLSKLKGKYSFHYLIVGDGPMRPVIEEQITNLNLQENVILVGRTENVKDYLFASDLLIHSSRGEGISNAILEGMYAGLPVIAANVGGVPETVYQGSSMLFPYKDHEALYNCLLKAPELIVNFDPSSEEYQAHLKKFSVETMVTRFEEIIDIVTIELN